MGRGLHINDVLPAHLRVHVNKKSYRMSKTAKWKGELTQMSREYLPEGYRPITELQNPTLDDIQELNEVITGIRINKFRDTKANMLLSALRCGMSVKKACSLAGITIETYRKWYERGSNGEEPYKQFFDSLEAIQAEMEQWCLNAIKSAATPGKTEKTTTIYENGDGEKKTTISERPVKYDWKAAVWLLEHIDPESYGKDTQPQTVTTNNTQIVVQLPNNNRTIDVSEPQPKKAGRPKFRKY